MDDRKSALGLFVFMLMWKLDVLWRDDRSNAIVEDFIIILSFLVYVCVM